MTQSNCISTVGVYAKGPKGDPGDIGPAGELTPEAEAARDAALQAKLAAESAGLNVYVAGVSKDTKTYAATGLTFRLGMTALD